MWLHVIHYVRSVVLSPLRSLPADTSLSLSLCGTSSWHQSALQYIFIHKWMRVRGLFLVFCVTISEPQFNNEACLKWKVWMKVRIFVFCFAYWWFPSNYPHINIDININICLKRNEIKEEKEEKEKREKNHHYTGMIQLLMKYSVSCFSRSCIQWSHGIANEITDVLRWFNSKRYPRLNSDIPWDRSWILNISHKSSCVTKQKACYKVQNVIVKHNLPS